MTEGLQKKNLDTSPDETRTFDHGVMKTATVGDFVGGGWDQISRRKGGRDHLDRLPSPGF
jgi:hypothetical protein